MSEPIWRPDPERAANAQITRFAAEHGFTGADAVAELWRWSVDHPARFWQDVWRFAGVVATREADEVLVDPDAMPGARWFVGARLNFAQNLLRRRDATPAILFAREDGLRRELSWSELWDAVERLAAALRAQGVGLDDRIAAFMPNVPETVVGALATSAVGGIWSSCSPDFGVRGVLDRFGQIEPKILFTVDGYLYGGKRIDIRAKVAEVVAALPSLVRVVVVPFLEEKPDIASIPKAMFWDAFCARTPEPLRFEQLPFDYPLYILYSSGTTGMPKAIVHGQGGTLVQHLKEHRLHTDLRPGERLFYYTTCGWMMWNWLVSGLASEATLVLYDGSPFHPGPESLWDLAQRERITVFGTSAKYLQALEKSGAEPGRTHDLAELKAILSTGSPLLPPSFDYVYEKIKRDVHLASISGGTDIVSCFVLGNPAGPVWRGEIQMRGLGMAVEVFDDHGRPVRGRRGELVCTRPFPSMPVGFWNDPEGKRYRKSYFERFPGVWCHGDWAEITEHDGVVIYGRSDATLNPGGVRIGTAEIYRQVEEIDEVLESVCVGQDWEGDVRVVLFVKLREGLVLDDALREKIRKKIRENTTPRHVPAKIIQVADIPRTMNGKISELAVRDVIHGRAVANVEALANPEALELFRDLPELKT
ncbi:MAG: acetoacetate--CoA ligase [Geminicoccaceae bacterium]|nr:acetoacetate--CoA ligase [Geminicoccaceae bacterium]MDW8340135.1 acetoacetate--CoA ligase [Geminicoccaceae bacterium]